MNEKGKLLPFLRYFEEIINTLLNGIGSVKELEADQQRSREMSTRMESLFQENDQVGRDGVPLPRE
jgi:hypothetical protein